MTITGAGLFAQVKADLDAKFGSPTSAQLQEDVLKTMCTSIVNYIKTNAVVAGPVAVASVGGVTPGGGVSGPGTGTLSGGTIS